MIHLPDAGTADLVIIAVAAGIIYEYAGLPGIAMWFAGTIILLTVFTLLGNAIDAARGWGGA